MKQFKSGIVSVRHNLKPEKKDVKINNGQFRNDIKVKLMSKTKNRTTKLSVNGFQCKFCLTESFQSDTALKKHIRDKHMKEMPFTCNICNVTFIDENVLKRHQENYHISKNIQLRPFRQLCARGCLQYTFFGI